MESVGPFEAKTRLSERVARAERRGEATIARNNRPVATVVPMGRARRPGAPQAALEALSAIEPLVVSSATLVDLIQAGRM